MKLLDRIRNRLSYATVVSAISAFIVLFGGAAFAANQLAKNSVGKKQLKANAVVTAKIKKDAVTAAKIKAGAIDGTKVKDGSLGTSALNLSEMPGQRIVHRTAGAGPVAIGSPPVLVPLDASTYTQAAGEDDFYYATVSVTFPATCEAPRNVTAALLVDAPNPTILEKEIGNVVALGETGDDAGGAITKTVRLGPLQTSGVRFRPETPTSHTLAFSVGGECKSGSGITASNAVVDVIGVR